MTAAGPSEPSFRDPSGFIYYRDGRPLRQVNQRYAEAFDRLHDSGLYDRLVERALLIPHSVLEKRHRDSGEPYATLEPEVIPLITYPYEWCFGQLRDAALVTLDVQLLALDYGMTLKDATAFNIQFKCGKPIHIDTLSFDIYREGQPWMGYNEFCRHFLGPLVLMATKDVRLGRLASVYLEGIPLDLVTQLIPKSTKLNPQLLAHLHLHARLGGGEAKKGSEKSISKHGLKLMLESIRGYVSKLEAKGHSQWSRYYQECTYTDSDLELKAKLVASFLDRVPGSIERLWDLGANTGHFSRLATDRGVFTVAVDADPWAVEHCYAQSKAAGDGLILPLVQDLRNMSPALGWRQRERESLLARAGGEVVMGLALVHHLGIGANVPFPMIASLFADVGEHAIVEFVPPDDPQSRRLMRHREDVFDWYTQENFEGAFLGGKFELMAKEPVGGSGRSLYLLKRVSRG